MENFKVGDVVARKSYDYDILFKVTKINSNGIIDLAGLSVRIVANAPDYDLKHIEKDEVEKRLKNIEKSRHTRINRCYMNMNKNNEKYNKYGNYYGYNNIKSNYGQNYSSYNIREQLEYEKPNVFKKETVLKRPGTVLHLDGDCIFSK